MKRRRRGTPKVQGSDGRTGAPTGRTGPTSGRHSPPKAGGGKDPEFRGGPFSAGIPAFGVIRTLERQTPFAALRARCLRPVKADGNEPPAALRAAVPTGGRRSLTGGAIRIVGVPVGVAFSPQRGRPPAGAARRRRAAAKNPDLGGGPRRGGNPVFCVTRRRVEDAAFRWHPRPVHTKSPPGGGCHGERRIRRSPRGPVPASHFCPLFESHGHQAGSGAGRPVPDVS